MSVLSSIIRSNRTLLKSTATLSIMHALAQTSHRIVSGKSKPEPAFIASIIFDGLPLLHCAWSQILKNCGFQFSIGGIYCHQNPYVEWKRIHYGSKPNLRAELGDLLLCNVCVDNQNNKEIRALLLQAKKVKGTKAKLKTPELHQLDLYKFLPKFTYDTPTFLKNQNRKIENWSGNPLKYLLLDQSLSTSGFSSSTHIASPDINLHSNFPLEEAFVRLLTNKIGRRVKLNENKGWSQVVKDLIKVGLNKTFNLKVAGWQNQPRINFPFLQKLNISKLDGLKIYKDSPGKLKFDSSASKRIQQLFDLDKSDIMTDKSEIDSGVSLVMTFTKQIER